jgi:hypothetical protein
MGTFVDANAYGIDTMTSGLGQHSDSILDEEQRAVAESRRLASMNKKRTKLCKAAEIYSKCGVQVKGRTNVGERRGQLYIVDKSRDR